MKAAYSRLLGEFPALVCASKRLPPVSHDVVHHIVTHGPPIASQFRKLDGEKSAAAKAEFKQLEEDDIIQRVSHTLTHADQARVGSGLCFSHFCYGANARRCEAPCTWSGN